MARQLPTTRDRWTQPNVSDITGDLFISAALDLTDNLGKIRLGKRLVANTLSTDSASVADVPVAFREYNHDPTGNDFRIYAICGSKMMVSPSHYPGGAQFTLDGSAPTSFNSNYSDMEMFQGNLYATGSTTLEKLNTNGGTYTWSTPDTTLDSGTHLLSAYAARLYITNLGNQIFSWDGSVMTKTGQYSLSLGLQNLMDESSNYITFIRSASNRIWIGTLNTQGNKGYIYEWDGVSTSPTKSYRLQTAGVVACVVKDDVPFVMDIYGRLLKWQGGTFVEVARLNRRVNKVFYNALSVNNDRYIHPNGMSLVNGKINILIDSRYNDATGSVDETIPAGIWEFDENMGLYCKHRFSVNHATDALTDWGANRIARAGALSELNFPDQAAARNGTFLAGAKVFTDATTSIPGIFYDDSNDTLQKGGYFVTPKLEATDGSPYNLPTVEGGWGSLYTFYRKLLNSTDRIAMKYRILDPDPVEAVITWTSSTTFTVSGASVDMTQYWQDGGLVKGEVEIMHGYNAGVCVHVSGAVYSAGTGLWTVTIDTAVAVASGTSSARFQNWKKIETGITPNNQVYNADNIGVKSTWIQIKGYMLFTGRDEIQRLLINNSNATPVK